MANKKNDEETSGAEKESHAYTHTHTHKLFFFISNWNKLFKCNFFLFIEKATKNVFTENGKCPSVGIVIRWQFGRN